MSKRRRNKGGFPLPAPASRGRNGAGVAGGLHAASLSARGGKGSERDPPRPQDAQGRPTGTGRTGDATLRHRFWETVALAEMTGPEWEALCDGCGKCCLLKLEDADTGRVHYTDVTCRLYDCASRSCSQYALRRMFVPGCVVLSPENIDEAAAWMPGSCAYRRLHEGRGLAAWHPLVSGDPASVERAGQAMTWPTVPEYEVADEDLEDHVLDHDLVTDDGESR